MEPDAAEIEPISDGQIVNPHGMDPQTVLRFVKTVGGWPGKVLVVACEPAVVEEMGLGVSPEVEGAVDRAVTLVAETITELQADAAYDGA
jgi:hydrogenase maturation protease